MGDCISADELLRLARLAASACGWPESAVRRVDRARDGDPPAVDILDHVVCGVRDSHGDIVWFVGGGTYEDVREAVCAGCGEAACAMADAILYEDNDSKTETAAH